MSSEINNFNTKAYIVRENNSDTVSENFQKKQIAQQLLNY